MSRLGPERKRYVVPEAVLVPDNAIVSSPIVYFSVAGSVMVTEAFPPADPAAGLMAIRMSRQKAPGIIMFFMSIHRILFSPAG